MEVQFNEWLCKVVFAEYTNGRTAIQLFDNKTWELVAVATVNLPEDDLEEDEVFIKGWSENAGLYEVLLAAGIIAPYKSWVNLGLVSASRCKLLRRE